jgi:hypothetical protein
MGTELGLAQERRDDYERQRGVCGVYKTGRCKISTQHDVLWSSCEGIGKVAVQRTVAQKERGTQLYTSQISPIQTFNSYVPISQSNFHTSTDNLLYMSYVLLALHAFIDGLNHHAYLNQAQRKFMPVANGYYQSNKIRPR